MRKFLLFVIFSIATFSLTFAGTTGKLAGKVTDKDTGEGLPFVNIILEGTTIGGSTDMDGNYVILNIPPGKYSIKVQYVGYQTQVIEGVSISIDLTTKVNVELSQTSVELGEVVVKAEKAALQKDITSSQAAVSSDEIEQLPVAELDDIIQLQAGVTRGTGGEFHIRGGRSSEIAYQVNGISVTDSYDKSRGIDIDNSAVQELQVISGTFNAEYGDAMSGVINTVTKEGGSKFHGAIKAYSSDYLSNHTNIFPGVDEFNPVQNYDLVGSLSGPIIQNKINFFANVRHTYDDGYLYGKREFTTTGALGDNALVPMNYSRRTTGIANLTIFPFSGIKLNFEGLYADSKFRDYNHAFKLNPDGDVTKFNNSFTGTFTLTHTFSQYSFYTVKASYFNRGFEEYLYENPYDPRYIHPDSLNTVGYAFIDQGTNNHRFNRQTNTYLAKFDFTSQVTNKHLLKIGAVFKSHKLDFDNYNLEPKRVNGIPVEPFEPSIPSVTSTNREKYTGEPIELSAYIQDKIEYNDVIINIGIRFDYFNSNGKVLVDPTDPNIYVPLRDNLKSLTVAEREQYFYKDAEAKFQIGPRFGIAYPVSPTGVIHFSYGHFLQVPPFLYLFNGGSYKVPTTGGPYGPYGNPDIKPQNTIMYELGLRQEFSGNYLIDVTMFYRDIRNWVTAGPMTQTRNGVAYSVYTNKDYANVKGVTLNFNKRFSDYWAFNLNYTFQYAEGSNSTPEDDYYAQTGNSEPTLYLLPLNWDQRHMLNASFYVGVGNWGASLIGRYGTGLPYTPSVTQFTADRGITSGFTRNTNRKPNQFNLDFKADYKFDLGPYGLTAFVRVFNLLDTKTVVDVFSDTGKPDFTTEGNNIGSDPNRPNTVEEYLTRPWYYSAPRLIQFGMEFNF